MKKNNKFLLLGLVVLYIFIFTACSKNKIDYMVLVNKQTKLPDYWEDKVELVDTKNVWNEDIKVEKKAYDQYKKLKIEVDNDLKDYNATIELDSVYRSVIEQQELWDEWSADSAKGQEYVKKIMAVPGYSEHHTGLAIDICLKVNGELIDENDDMIEQREIFSKVHAKLAKYGFILRYLENKDNITGYSYEPWHLRYIDNPSIAKEIMEKNLTLEEYLKK